MAFSPSRSAATDKNSARLARRDDAASSRFKEPSYLEDPTQHAVVHERRRLLFRRSPPASGRRRARRLSETRGLYRKRRRRASTMREAALSPPCARAAFCVRRRRRSPAKRGRCLHGSAVGGRPTLRARLPKVADRWRSLRRATARSRRADLARRRRRGAASTLMLNVPMAESFVSFCASASTRPRTRRGTAPRRRRLGLPRQDADVLRSRRDLRRGRAVKAAPLCLCHVLVICRSRVDRIHKALDPANVSRRVLRVAAYCLPGSLSGRHFLAKGK